MNLDRLYQEMILEHNKKPRNFGEISPFSHHAHGKNPLCGDDYHVYMQVNGNVVENIGFTGSGCAISKSSASMMTAMVKGKPVNEILALKDNFLQLVTTDTCSDECRQQVGRLKVFEGVKQFPVRVKCATLIWRALEAALETATEDPTGDVLVSTEE